MHACGRGCEHVQVLSHSVAVCGVHMYVCIGWHTCIECQSCAKKGERFFLADSTATDNPSVLVFSGDYCAEWQAMLT